MTLLAYGPFGHVFITTSYQNVYNPVLDWLGISDVHID